MSVEQRNSEKTERRILEHLDEVVLLFDREFKLKYINPAGEMMFSASARHILGQHAEALIQCPGGEVTLQLQRVVDMGDPFTEREIPLSMPDGRCITVDCTVIPLRVSESVDEVLIELRQVDQQLRVSREEQILTHHQAAQALVRGLAHEIKNPLGGLRGAAQLLERELPDQSLCEYTRVIIDEADRLQTLVNHMLGPNRLPEKQSVNLHQVLERVRNLVQAEAGHQVNIIRDYDPSIPTLQADSDQLIQAFLNIARNGVRAAAQGGGHLRLRTRVLRQFTIGNRRYRLVARVEIIDDGPGVSPDLHDRLFYPMVTGSSGGMGLGLSIAQTLVNQCRGLIECQSNPGETVFTVLLPVGNGNGERL